MRKRTPTSTLVCILSAALLSALVACGKDDKPAQDEPDGSVDPASLIPRAEEAACRFEVPADLGLAEGTDFRCGDLIVYENRDIQDSATIRLHYIQIDGAASDVATIYLDGGPGGDGNSILSALAGDSGVRDAVLAGGDFLSISQRGTGLSDPVLQCGQMESPGACGANLAAIADLPQYNTANNADDIDDLREALGYEALNLYGISYGSRLTLEVLRRHPENVRAAIAGGTVPSNVVWPAETPSTFFGAVNALSASCTADPACSEAFGDLSATMVQAIEDLNETPVIVEVFGQNFPLDGNTYASLIFQLLYSRAAYGLLPLVIIDLPEGRTDRVLDPLLDIFLGGGAGTLTQGMYYAVVCGELFNPAPAASVFETAIEGLPQPVIDATAPNFYQLQEGCASWPSGRPLPELSEIVTSDVPTLVSNGKLDPITPPRFGMIAKEGLVNAQKIDFANSGHGSTLQSECGVQVLADFLTNPDAAVDASCADTLKIDFVLPSGAAPGSQIDVDRIRREIRTAPTPPWIAERLEGLRALELR